MQLCRAEFCLTDLWSSSQSRRGVRRKKYTALGWFKKKKKVQCNGTTREKFWIPALIDTVTSWRIHVNFLLLFPAEKAVAEGSLLTPFLRSPDSVLVLVKMEPAAWLGAWPNANYCSPQTLQRRFIYPEEMKLTASRYLCSGFAPDSEDQNLDLFFSVCNIIQHDSP